MQRASLTASASNTTALPPELVRRLLESYRGPTAPLSARAKLHKILETAKTNLLAARAAAEEWRTHAPASLVSALKGAILDGPEDSGTDLLYSFVDVDLLLRVLQDPLAVRSEDAIELVRALAVHVPDLDLRLAKRFSTGCAAAPDALELDSLLRTLELLRALDCRERILPFLARACRGSASAAVSKVARLAGRCAWGRGLLLALLESPDARVRANAVEGLWETAHSAEKTQLLWRAASDPHHRVAVNALVGLARMGETQAVDRLLALASHPSPEFRAAVAWGLGELGDSGFREVLTRLYESETGSVRRNALRALVKLKQAELRSDAAPEQPA